MTPELLTGAYLRSLPITTHLSDQVIQFTLFGLEFSGDLDILFISPFIRFSVLQPE